MGDAILNQGCPHQLVGAGKKRKKAWKAAPLCLFWTLWKERNRRAFEDFELIDHVILHSFMYMFLERVRVHIESNSLSVLVFIDRLGCK